MINHVVTVETEKMCKTQKPCKYC